MQLNDIKGKIDFGIITIREDEFEAVLARLPSVGRCIGRRQYNLRRINLAEGGSYLVAVLRCIEQGNGEAQSAAHDLLEDLDPRWLLVVGIAGGIPSDEFSLGDVTVSTRVHDFSVEAVLHGRETEYALTGGPIHKAAAALAANLPALKKELGDWNSESSISAERPPIHANNDLFYGDDGWRDKSRRSVLSHAQRKVPLVTTGAIASSDRLIKDTEILAVWMKVARQVLAVEMESAGVYRAAYGRDVPVLAIRGISDIVGFKRDSQWTKYACHTAAAFALALMQTRPFEPKSNILEEQALSSRNPQTPAKSNQLPSPSQIGSAQEGQARGTTFDQRVAECYNALHYRVDQGRLFGGRQVSIFLTRHLGDITLYRAVDCRAGPVSLDELDSFIAKFRLIQREFPSVHGSIVSGVSFSPVISSHASQAGIQLTTYRELAAQLIDGHSYAEGFIREQSRNERYPVDRFVEPRVAYDTTSSGLRAFQVIEAWLADQELLQLTLLGDVGTGKTFLSRMIAKKLAQEFLADPVNSPLPLLIDLRNADRAFSLEGLIATHFSQAGMPDVSFNLFQHALHEGRLVVLFDGFDEMSAQITDKVTIRNFHELTRCVQGRAKVLLTCRTHYFRSRTEEEAVVLGRSGEDESEIARELYWDLVTRKGYKIAYLRPFEPAEVEDFVSKAAPHAAKRLLKKIKSIYNLAELSQRPMLLDMIVKSIERIDNAPRNTPGHTAHKGINAATLYEAFTNLWIQRDQWRGTLSPQDKLELLTALALQLWSKGASSIHYRELLNYVHEHLGSRLKDPRQIPEIDAEVRTATFLVRDDVGHYGFAHKSYVEFFAARHFFKELKRGNTECLNIGRASPEVIGFICDLSDEQHIDQQMRDLLTRSYQLNISENALLLLYASRLRRIGEQHSSKVEVDLPEQMHLEGARLSGAMLEGAKLTRSHLAGAEFREALLRGVDFTDSNLKMCDFGKANLNGAIFTNANLQDIRLSGANIDDTALSKPRAPLSQRPSFAAAIHEDLLPRLLAAANNYSRIYGSLHSDISAEDLESSVCERIVKMLHSGSLGATDDFKIRAYVKHLCHTTALDMARDEVRTRHQVSLDEIYFASEKSNVENLLDAATALRAIERLHLEQSLDPVTYRILIAVFKEDKTIRETAAELAISLSAAHKRLRRGVDTIKTALGEY